ncbi:MULTISPECIES: hypothetical protein [Actinomycetes]
MSPVRRLVRGSGVALVSVGGAALAHVAAGHHAPHWVVLLLALAVSTPLGVALTWVRNSRLRLLMAVLLSQAVLHGLYTMFPARPGGADLAAGTGVGSESAHISAMPDSPMAAAHLLAALFAYEFLRRGEVFMDSLRELLDIGLVLLLILATPLIPARPMRRLSLGVDRTRLSDQWSGRSSRTLRGPPALAA